MGHTNLRLSLEKRYAALTSQLRETREDIDRIKREVGKIPELEAEIPKLERLIDCAALLLEDNDPSWRRDLVQATKPYTHKIPVPFGSCGRRGMNILRGAGKPMTASEIALEVLRQFERTTLMPIQSTEPAMLWKPRSGSLQAGALNRLGNTRCSGAA